MPTETIALPRHLVNQILHYAQLSPETEVCGLIGARDDEPCSAYPVANRALEPRCRFELDPAGQVKAMRQMRAKNEALYAIFHSHPKAPAEPSPADLAEASYPKALHLIISLNTQGVLEMRGFRLIEGPAFREIELKLKEC